jgi:hypothetical protein
LTDPQFEILRNEIRDGFRASQLRDNALSQKVDAIQDGLSNLQYAMNSLMSLLIRDSEAAPIRERMVKTPRDTDTQREAR